MKQAFLFKIHLYLASRLFSSHAIMAYTTSPAPTIIKPRIVSSLLMSKKLSPPSTDDIPSTLHMMAAAQNMNIEFKMLFLVLPILLFAI